MNVEGTGNEIKYGDNISLSGKVVGANNKIILGNAMRQSEIAIFVNGSNNLIHIDDFYSIKGLNISCGNHVPANRTSLRVGRQFSIEPGCSFLLFNSGNTLIIGDDCLFSNGITIRCGESPHLLFDSETGEYLDVSRGVVVGDHVWIGERTYINKNAVIPARCIVAACSVVTRKFDQENCVIGGNPSRVVKKNIEWIRNKDFLEEGSAFRRSFDLHLQAKNSSCEEDDMNKP